MKNFITFLILAAGGYYIYKKGKQATAAAGPGVAPAGFLSTMKSGLYSSVNSIIPGAIPGASTPGTPAAPRTTTPPPAYVPYSGGTPAPDTGGGGGGYTPYDNGGTEMVNNTEQPYFTRDLTRKTPFVNL